MINEYRNKRAAGLSGLSLVIIVFFFAGGTLHGETTSWFGTISFDRVWVVKLFVVLVFSYTFWRYKFASPSTWNKFKEEALMLVVNDGKFKNYANELANESLKMMYKKSPGRFENTPANNLEAKWNKTYGINTQKRTIQIRVRRIGGPEVHIYDYPIDRNFYRCRFLIVSLKSDIIYTYWTPWILGWTASICILIYIYCEYIKPVTGA